MPRGLTAFPNRQIEERNRLCRRLLGRRGVAQLSGPIETTIPCGRQIAGCILAAEDSGENVHVELAHLTDVIGTIECVDEGMNVGQQRDNGQMALLVFAWIDDLPTDVGGRSSAPVKAAA